MSEAEKMRAEFWAWVEEQGCDTDGAWSAWQAAWNRRWARIENLRSALETIAAQSSGVPGSAARSDCMAAIARLDLRQDDESRNEKRPDPITGPGQSRVIGNRREP
jgi:hypothetical protein